ncbi:MAG: hypothetical protein QXG65_03800 [Thermoplasmata archaeon]
MRLPFAREIDGEEFHPTERTALAYLSPVGDLALFNDYAASGSILVRRPRLSADAADLAERWRPLPRGVRSIALDERIEGYGVFTFPYGPVAMGIPEAGGFDLTTYGERILGAAVLANHKRRDVEGRVVGRTVEDASLWIERRSGPFAFAHASAFLGAAESALGRAVPRGELWIRAIGQELQRITDHVRLIARVADAASQNVAAAELHMLEEELLRGTARAFGHRWGFGALRADGPPRHLDPPGRVALAHALAAIARRFDGLWESLLASRTFLDRLLATGPLTAAEIIRWGGVGPTLRAARVAWDDRLRHPTPPYDELFVALPMEENGDALARVLVRREEIRASFALLDHLLERWPSSASEPVPPAPPIAPGRGLARVEAPNGDLVYEVAVEGDRIRLVASRTPSQANWPLVALSLRGGVFTDFAFDVESFGGSFAESDG